MDSECGLARFIWRIIIGLFFHLCSSNSNGNNMKAKGYVYGFNENFNFTCSSWILIWRQAGIVGRREREGRNWIALHVAHDDDEEQTTHVIISSCAFSFCWSLMQSSNYQKLSELQSSTKSHLKAQGVYTYSFPRHHFGSFKRSTSFRPDLISRVCCVINFSSTLLSSNSNSLHIKLWRGIKFKRND